MSFQAMAWAVKQKVGNATGKAILLMLANYADERGECFPSQETLATECECSKRSVLEWLQKFEDMGILSRERRHGTGGYRRADLLRLSLGADNSRENISGENPSKPKCRTFTAEPITEPINTSSLRSDESAREKKPDHVSEALEAYSAMASRCGLPAVRILNETRKRKIASLLKTHGMPVWLEALSKVEASDFCRGHKGEFRADLDFLLQPQSFTRLLEGRYDNRQGARREPPPKRGETATDIWRDDLIERGILRDEPDSHQSDILDAGYGGGYFEGNVRPLRVAFSGSK